MRRWLAVVIPLAILFTLTCCGGGTDDPFSEYWNTSSSTSRRPNASTAQSADPATGSQDEPIFVISWPDEPSETDDSSASGGQASSEPSSQTEPSGTESSKAQTSQPATSRAESSSPPVSRDPSSKPTESSQTSSGTESSKAGSSEPASDDPSSGDTTSGGEETDPERPVFVKYVYLNKTAMVWFPADWTYTQSGNEIDASNKAKNQFITSAVADVGKGINESIVRDAMIEELRNTYSSSKGFSLAKTTVTLNDGKHPAVTIIKSDGTEPVRQQIYLLRGEQVLILTVSAYRTADIDILWTFVDIP